MTLKTFPGLPSPPRAAALVAVAFATAALTPTPCTAHGAPTVEAHSAATPPQPPRVTTGYAGPLTATTALVRTRVNPHAIHTDYFIEYGPTTTYGARTPTSFAGEGTTESLFTQTLSELTPNSTYHYRAVATSAAGTSYGQDASFKTKKVPLQLTLTGTPRPVVFGNPLEVAGTLTGTGSAGAEVVLQGNPFPYTHGFHNLTSPVPTSSTGAFSFRLAGLLQSTELRAATVARPSVASPVVTELVTARVTLHVRRARRHGYVRLFGTVTPAEPGVPVAFERLRGTRYVTVSGTKVRGSGVGLSHFARTLKLRRGIYRALVQIPSGAQIAGRSRPLRIR